MPLLSVVIITFNEERNIGRCLNSVKEIADDILVVDSFSTDSTESICRKYAVNFIQRKWEGYSLSKNFANTQAKFDWILSLDADEALSPQLQRSLTELKQKHLPVTAGFNRLTNYCGKWIHHSGWYPDFKIRVFDRRITSWDGIIHESLLIDPPQEVLRLSGDCLHYSYYTIEEHYHQAQKFSGLSATYLFDKGKRTNIIGVYLRPAMKFLWNYFIRFGFLDGSKGFTVCRIASYENYLKYSKLLRLQQARKDVL